MQPYLSLGPSRWTWGEVMVGFRASGECRGQWLRLGGGALDTSKIFCFRERGFFCDFSKPLFRARIRTAQLHVAARCMPHHSRRRVHTCRGMRVMSRKAPCLQRKSGTFSCGGKARFFSAAAWTTFFVSERVVWSNGFQRPREVTAHQSLARYLWEWVPVLWCKRGRRPQFWVQNGHRPQISRGSFDEI